MSAQKVKKVQERNILSCELSDELLARLDAFCEENERNYSYVLRKGVELFLDVFDNYKQNSHHENPKVIYLLGGKIDQIAFPKVYDMAKANPAFTESKIQELMKSKKISNKTDAMKALEHNI